MAYNWFFNVFLIIVHLLIKRRKLGIKHFDPLSYVPDATIPNIANVWPVSNFAQQVPATRNNMQQGVQMDAPCNIQRCWELLANNIPSICKRLYCNWSNRSWSTVEPQCATTSRKRPPAMSGRLPKHQNFPSQSFTVRTSRKRQPPVSYRDHVLGLTVYEFPLF